MLCAQFEGALYFVSVYAACMVYSRARSIRRARTIRGNMILIDAVAIFVIQAMPRVLACTIKLLC